MKDKQIKRDEANERNKIYRALTIEQKRELVATRPGNNTRELKRLARKE